MSDDEIIAVAIAHNIAGETTDAEAISFARIIERLTLERAAKVCDSLRQGHSACVDETGECDYQDAWRIAAEDIRALIKKENGE